MPASSSTSSAPKIGVPVRSASAIASDGRALTSTPLVEDELGVEDAVAQIADADLRRAPGRAPASDVPEQVVGQRARRHDALLGERDGGGLAGADPDGQVAVARRTRAAARSAGWRASRPGHRRRRARSRRSPYAARPARALPADGQRRRGRERRTHERGVQPHRQRRQLAGGLVGAGPSPPGCAAAHRRDDLLDQAGLAVGRGAERPQVPGLEAVRPPSPRRRWRPPGRRRR